jgi:hypothetical protein|tara:strand:+ start:1288 stop:1488 length:201 start_codon:yes stop_codon:yes gene_type:complete
MNKNSLMALDLLTMGEMDVRSWRKRVGRDSHGRMMQLGYIKTVPNKTGSVWYVRITPRGKERLQCL